MQAGSLRERVTFQRSVAGVGDGRGNYGTAFADIPGAKKIAADIAPVRATEVVLSEGVQGRRLYEVTLRYQPVLETVTVGDIMLDARKPARVFNVKAEAINPDKRRRRLKFLVELGGANG